MATVLNKNQDLLLNNNFISLVKNFFNEVETKLLQNASIQDPTIRKSLL